MKQRKPITPAQLVALALILAICGAACLLLSNAFAREPEARYLYDVPREELEGTYVTIDLDFIYGCYAYSEAYEDGKPTGWVPVDGVHIVTLRDGTMTLADLAALLAGKTAVVGNTRYPGNEYDKSITYVLDGVWETLYVYESAGMTVIQVGSPDESPKFIAYQ